jgi:hypothetical protein
MIMRMGLHLCWWCDGMLLWSCQHAWPGAHQHQHLARHAVVRPAGLARQRLVSAHVQGATLASIRHVWWSSAVRTVLLNIIMNVFVGCSGILGFSSSKEPGCLDKQGGWLHGVSKC